MLDSYLLCVRGSGSGPCAISICGSRLFRLKNPKINRLPHCLVSSRVRVKVIALIVLRLNVFRIGGIARHRVEIYYTIEMPRRPNPLVQRLALRLLLLIVVAV